MAAHDSASHLELANKMIRLRCLADPAFAVVRLPRFSRLLAERLGAV